MMVIATLEQQIIEQVRRLRPDQQEHVLAYVQTLTSQPALSLGEWLERARIMRQVYIEKYGDQAFINSVELLAEAREERLNDLMGGRAAIK
jgi:hypothetical protein